MDVSRFSRSPVGHLVPITGLDGRTLKEYRHHAFVPDALGPEPTLSARTWRTVARAGHALGRLHQAGRQVDNPTVLRRPTLRREAQSTSALEGTYAPLQDVLAADLADVAPSGELGEVLNYVEAAEGAFAWVTDGRPVTTALLREAQRVLVRRTPADTNQAGQVRSIQVVIGSPTQAPADARYVPPPPGPSLHAAFTDLVDWIEEPARGRRDPVVAAAMAHYQFEAVHPFHDGNGRIGRLLIVLQLLGDQVIDQPLLSVSPWFEARRREYQDRLAAVSAYGDWDGWIAFFAEGLEASALDTARRVDELLQLQADYVRRLREADVKGLARDVVDSLLGSPYVTVRSVATRTGRTTQAAGAAVDRLVALGVLTERTGRSYARVFEATEVVDILTAPGP